MAYQKHGTGPNDYKKGNRTKGDARKGGKGRGGTAEQLQPYNSGNQDMIEYYKELAKTRENVNKYTQAFVSVLYDNIADYIEEHQQSRQPMTVSGMIRASGMKPDAWYKARNGEYDHLLYMYMDFNGIDYSQEGTEVIDKNGEKILLQRMSDPIKMGELAITEQRELACSSLKGNPAGNIFLLKAQQGFRDDPDKQTNNNTLVMNIASLDEAKEALKRLE